MLKALKYLDIVRKRGEAEAKLKRVYRNIRNKDLFLMAYANLYSNQGATTVGVDPKDTVDGMSLKRIEHIIKELEEGTYKWKPVRRTYKEKKNSKKKRPLGIPSWSDKLVQEVMRMVLETYYEPQFRDNSHGFRPQKGCHTALDTIKKWSGVRWFIEGDIKACFDNISHEVILEILKRKIEDNRFLKLLRDMLTAGYIEDWQYKKSYSGTPQGSIISPLLANIVLNELDVYVENELIPKYTKGKKRRTNPEYQKYLMRAYRAKRVGNYKCVNEIRKVYTKIPSKMSNDPGFRRLKYARYADDYILGHIGTKKEAETIKKEIGNFLKSIKLEMSEEKTLITHTLTEKARFLNYQINLMSADDRVREDKNKIKKRTANGELWFSVPLDVIKEWRAKVEKKGKVIHRPELLHLSDYDIITTYEVQLQGLINYYSKAHNVVNKMRYLRYIWQESLIKTLAAKHKVKMSSIYRKHKRFITSDGRKIIGVEILREGKKPLIATFGRKPIRREKCTVIRDNVQTVYTERNELITRLLTDKCELCRKEGKVEGHHIRKLKNLKKEYRGKNEPPNWVKQMIAINRKTLFICDKCHKNIHNGTYDGKKLT